MATPNPMYYACFPLQEYFVNKDTGFPLAGGYVEFFSDPAFTVPKDVFQQSLVGGTTYDYVNLGSTLVLSSVGTFMDNNGDDIIPFLYPYDANGQVQLYFIRVWSGDPSVQGSVLQFTRQGWPPNFSQGTSPTDVFESSQNVFSNPEFAIVNFTPNPATSKYTIAVSGAGSFEVAPGWSLSYAGTGNLSVKQIEIVTEYVSTPSYALQVESDAGVVNIKLTQRLYQSPRTFYGNFLSASVLAACLNTSAVAVTIDYIPNSGTSYQIVSGVTTDNNEFELISGVNEASVYIDNVANTNPPSTGYIDLVINVPSGRIMQFTSLLAVTVQNASSLVTNIQSSNAQQTNGLFWYYKPELEYKPIPSYTLGWDFGLNPFQAQGTGTVLYSPSSPGKSVYVADQTILFQSTVGSVQINRQGNKYMQLGIRNNSTSCAIIQYLGPNEAIELLNGRMCVRLRAGDTSGNLIGQVNLYYTNAALPTLSADASTGGYSLVSAVDATSGEPTVGSGAPYGTWTKVNRSNLGAASFKLNPLTYDDFVFNGWDATGQANINTATYFAIVISFAEYGAGNDIGVVYATLQKGDIATPPAAMSYGETLTALQQYYEKSYDVDVLPATNTFVGALGFPLSATSNNTNLVDAWASSFTINYKCSKRAIATVNIYSPDNHSSGYMYAVVQVQATQYPANRLVSDYYNATYGKNSVLYASAPNNSNIINVGSYDIHYSAWASIQWVADARFGVV